MSRKSNQVQLISHMDRSIYRDNSFAGRVFIVTGGGSGIGLAIARELLVLGARCVIAGRNQNRLNQAVSECKCERLTAIRCNVRVEADVKALMRSVVDQFGRIDGLVCAAGGQFPSPAENISSKGWHAVIETNLTGSFMCAREVFAAWMETHGGSIVFITAEVDNGFPGTNHVSDWLRFSQPCTHTLLFRHVAHWCCQSWRAESRQELSSRVGT
jgi:NAD(P)-dependent dehydrogenase (short-subunit alcohol dehydrogenase family)